mmetsp:Transcript_22553/g.46863  ORF Transcript_22553/g.46863 Transcript_22553/m.46863 type:complete len:289 (-) Transcript_22553:257-1123(-)
MPSRTSAMTILPRDLTTRRATSSLPSRSSPPTSLSPSTPSRLRTSEPVTRVSCLVTLLMRLSSSCPSPTCSRLPLDPSSPRSARTESALGSALTERPRLPASTSSRMASPSLRGFTLSSSPPSTTRMSPTSRSRRISWSTSSSLLSPPSTSTTRPSTTLTLPDASSSEDLTEMPVSPDVRSSSTPTVDGEPTEEEPSPERTPPRSTALQLTLLGGSPSPSSTPASAREPLSSSPTPLASHTPFLSSSIPTEPPRRPPERPTPSSQKLSTRTLTFALDASSVTYSSAAP